MLPAAAGGILGEPRLPGEGSLDCPGDGVFRPPWLTFGNCSASGFGDSDKASESDVAELPFLWPRGWC